MIPKVSKPWLPVEKIQALVQLEPALVIVGLAFGAWLGYKLLLRRASEERHRNLQKLFRNLTVHMLVGISLFFIYNGLDHFGDSDTVERIATYIGLLTLLSGSTIFIKTARILVFEYLFLSHMKVAVPLLLVNLFTLLLSITLTGWFATEIFTLNLAPLLATSAILSVVLGLALQDTLGNLFAGVALQFDKPYELGDWVEVQGSPVKWVGQVYEVSWRATVLLGMGDEMITIPNRVMGQSEISNFSAKTRPFIRSQVFRLEHHTQPELVRKVLVHAAESVPEVRKNPSPVSFILETTESWIAFKLVYSIDNYGSQFIVGDKVVSAALLALAENHLPLANARVQVVRENENTV